MKRHYTKIIIQKIQRFMNPIMISDKICNGIISFLGSDQRNAISVCKFEHALRVIIDAPCRWLSNTSRLEHTLQEENAYRYRVIRF